jgi:hypothetical protein
LSSTDKSPLSPAAANFPGNIPNADSDIISREILSDGCFMPEIFNLCFIWLIKYIFISSFFGVAFS